MYVLVSVEPEGIVAVPGVQEREDVMFNIGTMNFCFVFVSCSPSFPS